VSCGCSSPYQSTTLRRGHAIAPAKCTWRAGILHPAKAIITWLTGHHCTVSGILGAPVARFTRIGASEEAIKTRQNEGGFEAAARAVDRGVATLKLCPTGGGLQTIVACGNGKKYDKTSDTFRNKNEKDLFSKFRFLPLSQTPMQSAWMVPSLSVNVPLLQGYLRPSPGQ